MWWQLILFLSPVIYFRLLWKQKNAAAAQRKELWRFSASPVDVLNSIFFCQEKTAFRCRGAKRAIEVRRGMQRWKDQLSCLERFSPFSDFNYELFSDEFSIHHGRSRVQLWMARDGRICKLIHSTMEILFVRWKFRGETLNLIRFLSSFSHNSEKDVNQKSRSIAEGSETKLINFKLWLKIYHFSQFVRRLVELTAFCFPTGAQENHFKINFSLLSVVKSNNCYHLPPK